MEVPLKEGGIMSAATPYPLRHISDLLSDQMQTSVEEFLKYDFDADQDFQVGPAAPTHYA